MALFKNLLISHDIMKFEDDYLVLHCSREDFVKAPFDGEITKGNTSCILSNGDFSLYISHIAITDLEDGKIKAGDIIGKPIADRKYGEDIAYIYVKLHRANKLQDMLMYLQLKDDVNLIEKKKVEEPISIETEVVSEANKKSSTKKKSTRKRK